MNLAGKVILITGVRRGIGRALARGFAADGAEVLIYGEEEGKVRGGR